MNGQTLRWLFIVVTVIAAPRAIATAASLSTAADSSVFRVAAIYPKEVSSKDFICITDAVFDHAAEVNLIPFKLQVFESGNDPLSTLTAARDIVRQQFDAAIGTRSSQEALAAAEIFEAAETPFIVPIASHPDVTKERRHVVRIVANSNFYTASLADYALDELHTKRVVIVRNKSLPFSTTNTEIFRARVAARSRSIAVETLDIYNGFDDFSRVARKVAKIAPDVLYLPIYSPQAVALYTALAKAKIKLRLLSNSSISDGRELFGKSGKPNSDLPIHFNAVWDGKAEGPLGRLYLDLMKKKCPETAHSVRSVTAFDAAQLLVEGLRKDAKLRGTSLAMALKTIKFRGVLGNLVFGPDGDPVRSLVMAEFGVNGTIVPVRKH